MHMHYPFNPISHYNKFGYYRVGQDLTYSKWQAQKQSYQTGQPIQWIFNDEEYAKINWTKEPEIPLEELYRIRAQQIRDRYDYVVVMYSGGADSHNALLSFLLNNIHIDEVAHITELNGDKDVDSFANAEIFKVAWPETKKLLAKYSPTTSHRAIDITDIILDLPTSLDDQEYITATSAWMTPGNLARSFLREKIPEYQEIISAGKKLCFVWGADKPLLATLYDQSSKTQYHAVTFSDRESCLVSSRQKYLNRSWEHDEFFYWSPELPELVCKQAHILRKMLSVPKNIAPSGHYGSDTTWTEFGWALHEGKLSVLSRDAGHSMIYPQWNLNTFSVGKTRGRVFGDRDRWLFKDITATSVGKMFQSVVHVAQTSSNWKDNTRGWPSSFSRLYPLEKIPAIDKLKIFWPFESNF